MRVERQVLFWLSALLVLLLTIGLLRDVLLPFVAGLTIAYFLNPLVDRISAMGLGRLWASVLIVLGVGVLVVALLVLVVPIVLSQAQQLAVALPGELEHFKQLVDGWAHARLGNRYPAFQSGLDQAARSLSENWTALAGFVASSLWQRGLALFNFGSLVLVTPLVVFYLLVDWNDMVSKIDSWLPRDHAPTIRRLLAEINDAVAAFIRGQGTVCLALGAFYATALTASGLKYGLLVGLATGILSFVPFVGWALGLLTAGTLAVVQFWPDATMLGVVLAVFLGGQAIDAAFLSPSIVGSKIGLHPVWLIFALFVFSYLFGFVGLLVAVPVAAAIGVVVRFALQLYLTSSVYRGSGGAVPPVEGRP